ADALGLKERPQIGGFDILADRFGLGALAECFRERETQCDHGDQKCDLDVLAGGLLGVVRLLHALLCAHDSLPPWRALRLPNRIAGARAGGSEAARQLTGRSISGAGMRGA